MAIVTYSADAVGPPCAIKIGPVTCVCCLEGGASKAQEFLREAPELWRGSVGRPQQTEIKDYCSAEDTDRIPTRVPTMSSSRSVRSSSNVSCDGLVDMGNPLISLVRLHCGERPEVIRELRACVRDSAIDIERLRSVIARHPFSAPVDWPVHEADGDGSVEYGARLEDGTSQWFRAFEFRGCNIVKGVAAILEVDLGGGLGGELLGAEPLGIHTARRDATWRVTTQGEGGHHVRKLWSYGVVDALDGPASSVVIIGHASSEELDEQASLLTPLPVRNNFEDFECIIYRFEPLWPEFSSPQNDGDNLIGPIGFRLTQTGICKLPMQNPDASSAFLKKASGGMVEHLQFHASLSVFLGKRRELDERMRKSPRTELYEKLRRHLGNLHGHAGVVNM